MPFADPVQSTSLVLSRRGERFWEVFFCGLLLVILSPVLLIAALGIKLSSPGTVFYVCMRPGLGGKLFPCYKLRSMSYDLAERQERWGVDQKCQSPPPGTTRWGRFLRRSSIDELPQLWNVVRGDMRLVGPRPLTQHDYQQLPDWGKQRYQVKPGLTGLWQVSGRSQLGLQEMLQLDLIYLKRRGFWTDLGILLRTLPAVLSMRGAC